MSDCVESCSSCEASRQIFCRTGMSASRYRVQWAVDDFSFTHRKEWLDSPSFTTGCRSRLSWLLRIYPSTVQSGVGYVFLRLVPLFFTETPLSYTVSIIDKDGQKQNVIRTDLKLYSRERPSESLRLIERKVLLSKKDDLLPNDCLTITCELKVAEKLVKTINTFKEYQNADKLSENLLKIFESSKFSDVTISVRDTEFHVHKTILSARSTVFAAMFEHEMNESKTNFIKIIDTYPKVMGEVLRYIYTGKFRGLKNMAAEVLPVADKYNLETLKLMCEEALVSQLTLEKAVTTLEQADAHNLKKLKEKTIRFIDSHRDEVLRSESWRNLTSSQPQLAVEVFTLMFEGDIYLERTDEGWLRSLSRSRALPILILLAVSSWLWYCGVLW